MKSIAFTKYGTTEDLELVEIEKPSPKKKEVLVKIHATSVNDWDWGLLRGRPYVNRLLFGLFKPKMKTLGFDIAGTIEGVGEGVTKFKLGDKVFGDISNKGWGGFAEYVCVDETGLVQMPNEMSFAEAAAIPQAGVLAIQGFYDELNVQPGQHILLNGAGGGCGTFAIQIAKNFGLEVTAVDKESKFDIMSSLGADHVIDYTKEDFTKNKEAYDYIIDFAGHHPLLDYKRALKENGKYLLIGGSSTLIMKCIFGGPIVSMFGNKTLKILPHEPNKYMSKIIDLFEAGKLKSILDKTYPLAEVPQALEYFGKGLCKGKIIISMGD